MFGCKTIQKITKKENKMITLNDYLYSGDTVLKILLQYSSDLKEDAIKTHNQIDLAHSNFLIQIIELLEHADFLTSQSNRIKEFYMYMTERYPFLAFTFKGRIKSLIRAEEKFNGYILEYIHDYIMENQMYPSEAEIKNNLSFFRDLIAYRIVISLPQCHMSEDENRESVEMYQNHLQIIYVHIIGIMLRLRALRDTNLYI